MKNHDTSMVLLKAFDTVCKRTMYSELTKKGIYLVRDRYLSNISLEIFVTSFFGRAMDTIYPTYFDIKVIKDPINIAYSSQGLEIHQDLPYYKTLPELQILHCVKQTELDDGLSMFVNLHNFATKFIHRFPEYKNQENIPFAQFEKIHFDRPKPVSLKLSKPYIELGKHSIEEVNWSPPFEKLELDVSLEKIQFRQRFRELLEQEPKLYFKLQEGDFVVFNNRIIGHGRTPIIQSDRHYRGCYISREDWLNAKATNMLQ